MEGFRNNMAVYCGINAAIIAEYLWEQLDKQDEHENILYKYGRNWYRCSHLMMTGEFPFMSIHMAKDAIMTLRKMNIIRKGSFNTSRFDRTNWYTFTDYGAKLMKEGEAA